MSRSIPTLPAPRAVAATLALSLAGCIGGDSPTGPEADYVTPDVVVAAAGSGQSVRAGEPFPDVLRAIVFTPTDHKCNGCNVVWTLSPGAFDGGPIHTKTLVTGASELRINYLTPAGSYVVRATIDNGEYAEFELNAL